MENHIYSELRDNGFSENWIERSDIGIIFEKFFCLKDRKKEKAAWNYIEDIERKINDKVAKEQQITLPNGKTDTIKPLNIELNREELRDEMYPSLEAK